MRIFVISSVLLVGLALGLAAGGAVRAGVPTERILPEPVSPSVDAMRALTTRCLPGLGRGGAVTTGLFRLSPEQAGTVLGDRRGSVWTRDGRILVVSFSDAPACRVIAASVDPAVLADLVVRVFREEDGTFRRERFALYEGGGFAAVYTASGPLGGMVVRISTAGQADGRVAATLGVERRDALP